VTFAACRRGQGSDGKYFLALAMARELAGEYIAFQESLNLGIHIRTLLMIVRSDRAQRSREGLVPKFKMLAARIAPIVAIVLAAGAGGKFHG
jgi:hypothetical protein